jgi:hypothetical protein
VQHGCLIVQYHYHADRSLISCLDDDDLGSKVTNLAESFEIYANWIEADVNSMRGPRLSETQHDGCLWKDYNMH